MIFNHVQRKLFPLLISVLFASNSLAASCESPSDYVRKVYSSEEGRIHYELEPSIDYQQITVVFFGKRGHVKRANTILKVDAPSGIFLVPERASAPPAQLWFNFVVRDNAGCTRWGLVNEIPLKTKGNLIGIDNPSGEGDAFFIKGRH